jgi:hypothetical protein
MAQGWRISATLARLSATGPDLLPRNRILARSLSASWLKALIAFVRESDAVAVKAENPSITDIDLLKKAKDKQGRPLCSLS